MDRQEGYYWVKFGDIFVIGKYSPFLNYWTICGAEFNYEDSDFEHINEHRIKQPGELPD